MLAVSPLRSNKDEREGEMESLSIHEEFPEFGSGNWLDNIDFDYLLVGINDEDVLSDVEMNLELLTDSSVEESLDVTNGASVCAHDEKVDREISVRKDEEEDKVSGSGSGFGFGSGSSLSQGEDIVSKRDESAGNLNNPSSPSRYPKEGNIDDKGRSKSSSANSKNPHGKRKVKVDWTPELHRRFVQAVEQLGVDKAVPSRILELMGIDCLTRHNIASHLQKYRSNHKHLLASEAKAANWNQRRQIYGSNGAAVAGGRGRGGGKNMSPWLAPPTMGFPPLAPSPFMQHFRPLHVWGHPSASQSLLMSMWPKHMAPSLPAAASWPFSPARPPPDPSFWQPHLQRVPNSLTPGTPCFPPAPPPPAMATTRFGAPTVPGIPHHHAMYRSVDPGIGVPAARPPAPNPPSDFHPTKESIDEAIGDALSKPWLPLPIGLKPPSFDSVMGELQRQGVSKIPPTYA